MVRLVVAATLIIFTGMNAFFFSYKNQIMLNHSISLKTSSAQYDLMVELAKTSEEQRRGLMFRDSLKEGTGMLFVNEQAGTVSFWMKNMSFPIDMLFIGDDLKVKQIVHSAAPCPSKKDTCPSYVSREPVQYVLEVPASYSKKHGISRGDELILNLDL